MTLAVWHGLAADESSGDLVVLSSPSVTVTDRSDGSTPQAYDDRDGNTALGNPFTAGSDGDIEFYVPPGRYRIEADDGAGNVVTWDDELIGTLHGIDSPSDGSVPEYDSANDRYTQRAIGTGNDDLPTGSDVLLSDPEHATDNGTDAFVSATNTSPPADGVQIVRDFQSPNTTTTPTLDGKTITDRDENALWGGAINGLHSLQYASGTDTYLLLYPIGTGANVNNAPVSRDSSGRAKFADPSAAQDAATKKYADDQDATFEQQRAQAWVNFRGTGTVVIRDSYNVSSVTDNGTGSYTVNFSSALADANYAAVSGGYRNGATNDGEVQVGNQSTGSVDVSTSQSTTTTADFDVVSIVVLGGN